MATRTFALVIAAALTAWMGLAGANVAAGPSPDQPPEGYAWAGACKDCHAEIHASWEKSKHARALARLHGESSRDPACVYCHVTGSPAKVEVRGDVVNAGVQCETCHGPSAAHVANPMDKPPMRLPPARVCEACHNEKSPHFRGFFYQGMLKFGTHKMPGT